MYESSILSELTTSTAPSGGIRLNLILDPLQGMSTLERDMEHNPLEGVEEVLLPLEGMGASSMMCELTTSTTTTRCCPYKWLVRNCCMFQRGEGCVRYCCLILPSVAARKESPPSRSLRGSSLFTPLPPKHYHCSHPEPYYFEVLPTARVKLYC